MKRARVLREYRTQYHDPIEFRSGETVQLGQRDSEWPEFIWATDPRGRSGWAPSSLLSTEHSSARALADYSARELDADAGQIVHLLREVGGWWWAKNSLDQCGWIPARDLHILEDAT